MGRRGCGPASYQATYTAAKGLLAFGDDLKLICDPEKDWCADFDDEIVSEQNADGSWPFCNWSDGSRVLCTILGAADPGAGGTAATGRFPQGSHQRSRPGRGR